MKKIMNVLLLVFFSVSVFSQPKDWHHLDLKADSIFGVSTNKAYSELLKNKKPSPVIVAVIDSGIDTTHEDLSTVLWVNTKEKTNGIDDDKNGYADDKFGWSFIEGIKYDNLELTRLLRKMRNEGDTTSALFVQLNNEYLKKYNRALSTYNAYKGFSEALKTISDSLQTLNPTLEQLQNFKPGSPVQERVLKAAIAQVKAGSTFTTFKKEQIDKGAEHFNEQLQYHLNLQFLAPASMGSSNVIGADADHGTHVAGIIGADRMNNKGIEGIAHVRIMAIRAVPNGDERDEDVAKAIRYAADNGAKIINMSFGKPYSPGKQLVDDAVKYAMQKDVLMVHGAGNDNFNLDSVASFPTRKYLSGNEATAWIEVGASGAKNDGKLKAGFSNYGNAVDVFAPGVSIYSSTPGSQYAPHDGTSMAAPVVAGIAALIRGYYPKLTAVQVKDIIMQSVIKAEQLAGKCKTGGVVNAYEALKLAATYK